jgi:hypothetical protein
VEEQELRQVITDLLKQGQSLSDIYDHVTKERGHQMTFLDLRLLIADLNVQLPEEEDDEPPAPPPPAGEQKEVALPPGARRPEPTEAPAGATSLSVDSVTRPGVAMSGQYTTRSGAKGSWFMDAYGRVGLEAAAGSAKPSTEDMAELQQELGDVLRRQSGAL